MCMIDCLTQSDLAFSGLHSLLAELIRAAALKGECSGKVVQSPPSLLPPLNSFTQTIGPYLF